MNPTLTPDALLRLYAASPSSRHLGPCFRDVLAISPSSRWACAHLLPLFEARNPEGITYFDLFLTHTRHEGGAIWRRIVEERLPHDSDEAWKAARGQNPALYWGLAEAMGETSREVAPQDAPSALRIASLAFRLASRAPLDPAPEACRQELLAWAHACRANALRLLDRLPDAVAAMELAERHLSNAGRESLGLAPHILSLRASLETWQENDHRALRTLTAAFDHPAAEDSLRVRLLIKRALVRIYLDAPLEAMMDLEEAGRKIEPRAEPRLWWCMQSNRLILLTRMGRWDEAEALLPEVANLVKNLDSPTDALLVQWIEARITEGQGDSCRAEAHYLAALRGYLSKDLPYRAAAVSLDLSGLLFEQGRLAEVRHYADEMIEEFQRQEVEVELLGAFTLLEQAVLGEFLTADLLATLKRQIERRGARGRRR